MAVLGVQLGITLIVVSIIQKLSPYFSFARWTLCSTGLTRYLYPTDSELRTLAGVPKEKPKKGKHAENGRIGDVFQVPRSLDVTLQSTKLTPLDVVHLKFYLEYQWLLDFSVYAVIVYILTEIYSYFYPLKDEINLSMLWCTMALLFAFKVLITLWMQYFKGDENVGERSTCIVSGFAYLLVAMAILIVDENILELGLERAYESFNHGASIFLDKQGLSSAGPASKIVVKFFLALWCGFLGSLLTFPGLRMSKMHWDTLNYYKDKKWLLLLLNASYASPMLLVCLWIKPISRDYLTVRVFSGMSEPLMSTTAFESFRLLAVVLVAVTKLAIMPIYLQSHLNLASQRLEYQKKEAGRITNVDLQKKIAAVFYYLCVVALQFVAPIIVCLCFSLMCKTLGGYKWSGILGGIPSMSECPVNSTMTKESPIGSTDTDEATIAQTTKELHLALESLKQIFTTEVFRGLLGFVTWWSCFTLFASTAMGMVYQSYFSNV
ncbi:transmembrane protein 161B [Orussus abietinus]|uniref:transmembrane protein 161B n=1 Tax=Orussus abietinus TaxID=222816 RepID=UPI00062612D0|nr:transmembrane protein 161B [Orussus abietinus]